MGDRVAMIEQACKEMEATGFVKILQTSSLYETKAMYVLDQDKFVNGACEIATSLPPLELLDLLQSVENRMGRVKVIDKGPRNIDLDILLYSRAEEGIARLMEWSDERLVIPHKLMFEREFVLRPLYEILHSENDKAFDTLLKRKLEELRSDPPLSPLTPLGQQLSMLTPHDSTRCTQVMSILNVTPDSFSDGGKNYAVDEAMLRKTILDHVAAGATMIDIGGQSTRPGAVQVSAAEEASRVVPAIRLVRSLQVPNLAISVDTYRADVAEAAIQAGAHMINDVSAGLLDHNDKMLRTAASQGCTICLMHMRGSPQTMHRQTDYPRGLVDTVAHDLLDRVHAAESAGIRRWRILLDPGIGFAKTTRQNCELLRQFAALRRYPGLENFPWLVGTSRKTFIGSITGVEEPRQRVWGTAATVAAAVQGGADIVRVHDVGEMAQVARMSDAIWRV
ncbi:trifunctional dihydropteroate synthetase [Pleosporales sp. CAS-2024a]